MLGDDAHNSRELADRVQTDRADDVGKLEAASSRSAGNRSSPMPVLIARQ
jgi:hypothetical protein